MNRVDALIVGAGAAGVGVGLALKRLGVNIHIVDRLGVGASFRRWPQETRFITPSFTANAFGLADLNALNPETSPAYSLGLEHPSGLDYARYLRALVQHYQLPFSKATVRGVQPLAEGFRVETSQGPLEARFLIWATGEFQFPQTSVPGASLGLHYGRVKSWAALEGNRFVVVGGYESGLDAAYHLAMLGKQVTVLDPQAPWEKRTGEPSVDTSPFTRERLHLALETGRLELRIARVSHLSRVNGAYRVHFRGGGLESPTPPILATGFDGGWAPVQHLFEWEGTTPLLREETDESTRTPGLFLVGPKVRHRGTAFCFIYKFRGRFPVVAQAIGERLGLDTGPLEVYRQKGIWADDLLSCCSSTCTC
ncbi:NAD(P)/FAD-dependent oxidoreductase [Meiothermus sp. CFH 77666]|uniref:NAD(P)/FAD-dependent oxidoreductase n=1 Tax=Meiothermus sp. CFH 77666 TaxID=2817942 RepID=UPI001AA07811|nr:NAD(P)/FAD-dependent oxidoreductase [Meiothermus sp. CFH 77666]MBO1438727.1 NAD(P)-binding domain-containing protein [Meiothermus sp. CFH 77666]